MGVTLNRIGLISLVLGAVLLPLWNRESETVTPQSDGHSRRLRELSQEVAAARVRWSALEERDSALAALTQIGKPGMQPVVRLNGFPLGMRATQAESTITRLWKQLGAADSTAGVALLVYNSASYSQKSWWSTYWGDLITQRGGVTWCVAITHGEIWQGHLLVGREQLEQAIAPCVLYAAFGPPGPGMRDWLNDTRYVAARSNGWLGQAERPMVEGDGNGPWARWFGPSEMDDDRQGGFSLARAVGGLAVASLLAPPYRYGAPGIRCLYGETGSCRDVVLHSGITLEGDRGIPRELTISRSVLLSSRITLTTPRPPAPFFLSDLIREHGRESFRKLWKSQLPFEAAFQAAFDESLGAWTERWAKRLWLGSWEAKDRSQTILLGANLRPSWPLIVIGWTGLALAAVAWVAQRRQVT